MRVSGERNASGAIGGIVTNVPVHANSHIRVDGIAHQLTSRDGVFSAFKSHGIPCGRDWHGINAAREPLDGPDDGIAHHDPIGVCELDGAVSARDRVAYIQPEVFLCAREEQESDNRMEQLFHNP